MLTTQIQNDLVAAMRAGDQTRLSVLRMLKSALMYVEIDAHHPLSDEEVITVVGKEVKKRREAVESYTAGGRSDQAAAEAAEMAILQEYMPKQMSEEEVRSELIQRLSDQVNLDFPGAMKLVSPMFRGKADGGMVARIVKEILASK